MKKKTNPRKIPASKADVEKAKKEAEYKAIIMTLAIPLMAAHDVFGFGPKRITRLFDNMMQKFNDYEDGLFSAEDANRWMAEYAGIEVEEG